MRCNCLTQYRFRLAACQLDELKSCVDRQRLMEALKALPTTLQEMYTRILDKIQRSDCYREAMFMLQYVLWTRKPPLFSEMIDAIAVRLDESPGFKRENRLFELMDVITQCSSLLTPVSSRYGREIHLAHSSVKEYLTSQHLTEPFKDLLSEVQARSTIAKTSMKYMLDVVNFHHDLIVSSGRSIDDLITMSSSDVVLSGNDLGRMRISAHRGGMYSVVTMCESSFPFLRAASYWAEHAAVVEIADDDIPRLVMHLYGQEHLWRSFPQILGSGLIYGHDYPSWFEERDYRPEPLTHACFWGLGIAAQRLLESYAHLFASRDFDSALFAACCSGHHSIVEMLLDRGAAVNGCATDMPSDRSNPLDAASANGHIEIVNTLLRRGARTDGDTVEAATTEDNWEILRLLVGRVDNIPLHQLRNALYEPIEDQMVSLLCSKPIVVEGYSVSSSIGLLSDLLHRNEIAYAKLYLEKGFPEFSGLLEFNYDWPKPPEQEHLELARMMLDKGWILLDNMVQCVKLSDEKESQRPEKRPRLEYSLSSDNSPDQELDETTSEVDWSDTEL